ncbi:methyltransferase [Clostridium carboxidivorans P7]|uniref:S-adenosyl-L-methionine-dependent methyltransferase n=1 Tax=Clostridium carboxidivorans P7 TaxID=536227 RepID=C6PMU5_9CLOT|nr:class I SAM-dependent methyltransferase [Clostridium carboxidivorans]AKN29821.1 methyltransferase [Clostridium carboxidivorans P7]EET89523.1 methyltransferase [Clostridium carboxidivorans P7]
MEQKSITALVSAFSRAYHSTQNSEKIFDDYLAKKILTEDEYEEIANNMAKGISFFNPSFSGTQEEALRWVVDNQLSPTPLSRGAFAEGLLKNAVQNGAKQYLIFAAGYDTFAYRQSDWASKIEIFEIDHPATAADKQKRIKSVVSEKPANLHYVSADFRENNWQSNLLECIEFDKSKISFCSLLGISYYLSKQVFAETLNIISGFIPKGSSIVFDYNDEKAYTDKAGERAKIQVALAGASNEKMLGSYSYMELEKLLSESNFMIYEHLTPDEITEKYFTKYNKENPNHQMTAFDNVNYCLAVRK